MTSNDNTTYCVWVMNVLLAIKIPQQSPQMVAPLSPSLRWATHKMHTVVGNSVVDFVRFRFGKVLQVLTAARLSSLHDLGHSKWLTVTSQNDMPPNVYFHSMSDLIGKTSECVEDVSVLIIKQPNYHVLMTDIDSDRDRQSSTLSGKCYR